MPTSLFLAQLIGPVLVAIGGGMLVSRDAYREMAEDFLDNAGLIYLSGVLALVAGLSIVLAHNVWVADWRVIITLIGWLAVAGGLFRLLVPQQVARLGASMLDRPAVLLTGGVLVLVLGAILSFHGYFP